MATDAGTFVVKAKNPLGEVTANCQLVVHTLPKFVKQLTTSNPVTSTQVEIEDDILTKLLVNEKTNLKLECQVTGLPKPTIKWFCGDEEIKNNDKFKLEAKQDNYYLNIKSVGINERATYKVIAENSVGASNSRIIVDLNTIPSFVKDLSNTDVVLENNSQNIEFVTVFQSKPKSDVSWFFGTKELKDGDSNDSSNYFISEESQADAEGTEITTAVLKIQNISLKDAGNFKCKIKNCASEATSTGALVISKAPVILQPLPAAVDLNEKTEIKLECKIEDSVPKSVVSWHKDGLTLNASKRVLIGKPVAEPATNSFIYNLNIPESTANDFGLYSIKAANKVATVESSCQMKVLCAPKIVKDLKPKIECSVGDRLSLDVTAVGTPQPDFKWFFFSYEKNSEVEIENQEGLIEMRCLASSNLYQLNFVCIKKEMLGKYLLKLTNVAGEAETSCDFSINSKLISFVHLGLDAFKKRAFVY